MYQLNFPVVQKNYLVGGEIIDWEGERQPVFSPVSPDKEIGSYPLLSRKEAMDALDAAEKAFLFGQGAWPTYSVEQRIEAIKKFLYKMKGQRDIIISLLMWEIGKVLGDAEREFDRTVEYIEETIDALKELDRTSSRFVIVSGVMAQIRRSPLGVVLCMGPFNYPLNETFTTLIPALIMGNSVILKPPKLGVLLFSPLIKIFQECFPAGVINILYGEGKDVVAPLMESGRINCLAFIGSGRVADILKGQHPHPHRLRCILGLEAKNPAIILSDAPLEETVKECLLGSLSFNGQRCTALKLFFVHEKLMQNFLEQFAVGMDKLKMGAPWEEGVKITALPEPGKVSYLQGLVDDAVSKGAKIINERAKKGEHNNGCYYPPTLLSPIDSSMRLYHEEQFGPVVGVVPFSDINVPIRYIIDSPFGQQVAIFGHNEKELATLIDPLVNQVCRVNINSQCQRGPDQFPFTGRKGSAEGTLSISDALKVFSIRSLVSAKVTEENKEIFNTIVKNRYSKFLSTDFIL